MLADRSVFLGKDIPVNFTLLVQREPFISGRVLFSGFFIWAWELANPQTMVLRQRVSRNVISELAHGVDDSHKICDENP